MGNWLDSIWQYRAGNSIAMAVAVAVVVADRADTGSGYLHFCGSCSCGGGAILVWISILHSSEIYLMHASKRGGGVVVSRPLAAWQRWRRRQQQQQ